MLAVVIIGQTSYMCVSVLPEGLPNACQLVMHRTCRSIQLRRAYRPKQPVFYLLYYIAASVEVGAASMYMYTYMYMYMW